MGNQPVRLGLYGCGNRTRALLDTLYGEDEYTVVGAFDIRPDAVQSVCERYGGRACRSADELLDLDEPDAWLISLDPLAHPDAFDQTVETGKPIFIEKPIAMTAERAFRMMRRAQDKSVPVHVGFMRRYLPQHKAARRFLAENDTGRMFSVTCTWHHAGETEMINCLNNFPDNFRLKVSQIPFHACHSLDVILLYGGEVRRVQSRGMKWIERHYPSPDGVIALLEFASGAIGYFHYSSVSFRQGIGYQIHTENYTLTFENGLEIYHRPKFKAQRDDESRDCRPVYHSHVGPDRFTFGTSQANTEIMLDFLNAVRNATPMKVPIEDACKAAQLAEAIEQSWQQDRPIDLPMAFPD